MKKLTTQAKALEAFTPYVISSTDQVKGGGDSIIIEDTEVG